MGFAGVTENNQVCTLTTTTAPDRQMKSSHIPKKAPSFTYPVQLLEKISSSANDLWDDYFGGVAILHCLSSQEGLGLRCMHEARTEASVLGILDGASSAVDHGSSRVQDRYL